MIISGHRRRFCALRAGLDKVPVIRHAITYSKDRDAFMKMWVDANEQREKTAEMRLREAAMKVDPDQAYADLLEEQREKADERRYGSTISDNKMEAKDTSTRKKISKAKQPFLDAAIEVINAHRQFWPLSVRQVHYRLLNDPPLRHASKPDSTYVNDGPSYRDLSDILARGRIEGQVPWEAIDDETRSEDLNNHFWTPDEFATDEIKKFLRGFIRSKQQSQPDHIEIVAEKLTVKTILKSVAEDRSIPLTILRGQSGPTIKKKVADRFRRSKKQSLIVLVVSDLDPAGETIVQNWRDDLEADFGIPAHRLEVYRAGLTMDRAAGLEPSGEAKTSSPTYEAFVEKYDTEDMWELEAMEPEDLQDALIADIEEAMDMDAFEVEVEQEREGRCRDPDDEDRCPRLLQDRHGRAQPKDELLSSAHSTYSRTNSLQDLFKHPEFMRRPDLLSALKHDRFHVEGSARNVARKGGKAYFALGWQCQLSGRLRSFPRLAPRCRRAFRPKAVNGVLVASIYAPNGNRQPAPLI